MSKISTQIKDFILIIIRDLFGAAFGLFLIFCLLEIIKPRIVTNYINLSWLLLALIIIGFVTFHFYQPYAKQVRNFGYLEILALALISSLTGIAVIFLTHALGYLSLAVGLATIIITYFILNLCLQE